MKTDALPFGAYSNDIGQVMLICTGLICVYPVNKYVQRHIVDSEAGGLDPPVLGDLRKRP